LIEPILLRDKGDGASSSVASFREFLSM